MKNQSEIFQANFSLFFLHCLSADSILMRSLDNINALVAAIFHINK